MGVVPSTAVQQSASACCQCNCSNPPIELLVTLQMSFVNFLWDRSHWLPPGVLYLPVAERGQVIDDGSVNVPFPDLLVSPNRVVDDNNKRLLSFKGMQEVSFATAGIKGSMQYYC